MKQLKVLTAVFWVGVAGVLVSFVGTVTTAIREKKTTQEIIEAHPIPVPALPAR